MEIEPAAAAVPADEAGPTEPAVAIFREARAVEAAAAALVAEVVDSAVAVRVPVPRAVRPACRAVAVVAA